MTNDRSLDHLLYSRSLEPEFAKIKAIGQLAVSKRNEMNNKTEFN